MQPIMCYDCRPEFCGKVNLLWVGLAKHVVVKCCRDFDVAVAEKQRNQNVNIFIEIKTYQSNSPARC